MILWLTTFGISIVSALVPFLPIEFYILGAGASEPGVPAAVALGIAAGAGATVGKIIWYEVARRGAGSRWAQRRLSQPKIKAGYDRWVDRLQGRPWFGIGVVFVAASAGIPPLLVVAAVAGVLRMPLWAFVPTVLVGRTIRFTALFLGVDVALH
ncbi:VTT domain-containing protein [Nocardioides sp. TF02-7]|uniref:VTT domain-containing protein n=1 Tax=Nocardioides sp. TF02-7 TaxID=2917724 RepID=UPI001F053566|nr:VTT domain-containing protein [Nocardioides sp. TF02-7]UMG92979.1 VTT domain-containing protein [Nocardioides sp. TF02-7]